MDPTGEIQKYLQQKGVQHAVIKGWLDQFAHDLAEAQRKRGDELLEQARADGASAPHDSRFDVAAAWYAAADLIDPEVE